MTIEILRCSIKWIIIMIQHEFQVKQVNKDIRA